MAVQPGLCRTWSETPKIGFLRTRLNYKVRFVLVLITRVYYRMHIVTAKTKDQKKQLNREAVFISDHVKSNIFKVSLDFVERHFKNGSIFIVKNEECLPLFTHISSHCSHITTR